MQVTLCLACKHYLLCIYRTKFLTRAADYGLKVSSLALLECEHYEKEEK